MPHYLIEFRFSGYAKQTLKELIRTISRNFHVQGATKRKVVPHITLVGPLYTTDGKKLVKEIKNVLKKYELVGFKLDGFGNFQRRVIHVNIKPSEELIEIREKLVEKLEKFCKLDEYDYEPNFQPHATLALKDISRKFDKIIEFLDSWKVPKITQHVLRVTVLGGNSKIVCEYDLMLKKLLSRREALDRGIFKKTLEKYRKKQNKFGIQSRKYSEPEEEQHNGKIFVASDLHFDHENIIQYCNRPFRSRNEMNQTLLDNWNSVVGEFDKVYYLGDLTYGRKRRPIDYWLSKLNGEVCFIRGNHDTDIITKAEVIEDKFPIKYKGFKFLLMHEPYRPAGWDGWIIHGDKHNNNLEEYPHINMENKTINVCAEVTAYAPISLDSIIVKIR